MTALFDLFDVRLVPGLDTRYDVIAPAEGTALSPFRFQQWTGKRLTRSFGWSYDFENGSFQRADPIPSWLEPLKARAAQAFGMNSNDLVQALLIRYDPGAGIGWHKDRPVFGDVIGLSLGAPATMRFRRRAGARFERVSAPLAPRSLYRLTGDVRHGWEHSIAAMDETRWSITFRTFANNR